MRLLRQNALNYPNRCATNTGSPECWNAHQHPFSKNTCHLEPLRGANPNNYTRDFATVTSGTTHKTTADPPPGWAISPGGFPMTWAQIPITTFAVLHLWGVAAVRWENRALCTSLGGHPSRSQRANGPLENAVSHPPWCPGPGSSSQWRLVRMMRVSLTNQVPKVLQQRCPALYSISTVHVKSGRGLGALSWGGLAEAEGNRAWKQIQVMTVPGRRRKGGFQHILKSSWNPRQNHAHSTLVEPLRRNVLNNPERCGKLGPGNWRCCSEEVKKLMVPWQRDPFFPWWWKPEPGLGTLDTTAWTQMGADSQQQWRLVSSPGCGMRFLPLPRKLKSRSGNATFETWTLEYALGWHNWVHMNWCFTLGTSNDAPLLYQYTEWESPTVRGDIKKKRFARARGWSTRTVKSQAMPTCRLGFPAPAAAERWTNISSGTFAIFVAKEPT